MCLSIPSKVVSFEEDNMVVVDTMGVRRTASLDMLDEPLSIGDYILIHVGFAISKIDEESAKQSIDIFEQILAQMDEEERNEAVCG